MALKTAINSPVRIYMRRLMKKFEIIAYMTLEDSPGCTANQPNPLIAGIKICYVTVAGRISVANFHQR
jgi:hypothetical protein